MSGGRRRRGRGGSHLERARRATHCWAPGAKKVDAQRGAVARLVMGLAGCSACCVLTHTSLTHGSSGVVAAGTRLTRLGTSSASAGPGDTSALLMGTSNFAVSLQRRIEDRGREGWACSRVPSRVPIGLAGLPPARLPCLIRRMPDPLKWNHPGNWGERLAPGRITLVAQRHVKSRSCHQSPFSYGEQLRTWRGGNDRRQQRLLWLVAPPVRRYCGPGTPPRAGGLLHFASGRNTHCAILSLVACILLSVQGKRTGLFSPLRYLLQVPLSSLKTTLYPNINRMPVLPTEYELNCPPHRV